jgi:hypothetical protein
MNTRDNSPLLLIVASLFVAALLGCQGGEVSEPGFGQAPQEDADFTPRPFTAGSPASTFDHPASLGGPSVSAGEALARMTEEGPPAYTARVHSCRKMKYATIGNVLRALGVDMGADDGESAGRMYRDADQALGAPNYGGRISETTELTVASASRLFDILVQAAPEIISSLPGTDHCSLGASGRGLFDESGYCTSDGLTCLLGTPASTAHVALCNDTIDRAATPEQGQRIAVASLLAASFTCE